MTQRGRIISGVLAGLLAIWACVLFFQEPVLTFHSEDTEITCDSVVNAGWPERLVADSATSRSYTFSVTKGELPEWGEIPGQSVDSWEQRDRIESECDRRRTTYAAGMALLLAPAAVLASVALFGGRRVRVLQGVAGADGP
ncbi:hypothetical protein ACIBI4_07775 [Streptomyces sp. NPDC050418]|uniref:hypothetical protein n=1 Tax=Streptomyces sp. NPDC050418 TaxID=3365612 RepID=UPI0037B85DE7